MITLYRDRITNFSIPYWYNDKSIEGSYSATFYFSNCSGEEHPKEIDIVICGSRLLGSIEHTCDNITSSDSRINYDVGTYNLRIEFAEVTLTFPAIII